MLSIIDRIRHWLQKRKMKGKTFRIEWTDQALYDLSQYAKEEGKTLEQLREEIEKAFCNQFEIKAEKT